MPKPYSYLKMELHTPLRVISVGRSHWKKGYTNALDAFKIIHDKGIKFQYTIIGVADFEPLIFQRAQLELEATIGLLNVMPITDVKDSILAADILFLPSIEEGVANVVLEAMALGTLVVSSDCGGMSEVVRHNENGLLFKNGDLYDMTKQLLRCVSMDIKEYQRLTQNARRHVEQNHQIQDMINKMIRMYNTCLQA